jgi:hypothetical protein
LAAQRGADRVNHPRMVSKRHGNWVSLLRIFEQHRDRVNSVSVSLNGLHIICGSDDDTGENTRALEGHTDPVQSVAFSPDGLHIISGSDDRIVRVWDARIGENTRILEGHIYSVLSVASSLVGEFITSQDATREQRTWEMGFAISERSSSPAAFNDTASSTSAVVDPALFVDPQTGWVHRYLGPLQLSQRQCWLPFDRRPPPHVPAACHRVIVTIGSTTGIVAILYFSSLYGLALRASDSICSCLGVCLTIN